MLGKALILAVGLATVGVSMAQYQAAAAGQYQEDYRVDEKDYSVGGHGDGGFFNYLILGMPMMMIPLILLLCTPIFHKPHEVPYGGHPVAHHGHGHHGHDHHHGKHHDQGWGYGWGTYNLGWKRSVDGSEQDGQTRRVSSSGSNKKKRESG